MIQQDFIVIGGGAAGIFAALAAQEAHPSAKITVLEKNNTLLAKVRISGGGRCNVTHACFDPKLLVKNYPRGHKELLGPFHRFHPQHTVEWFAQRGVLLKTEDDGRMFPTTDSSSTIIDCLLHQADKLHVNICLQQKIEQISKKNEYFEIVLKSGIQYQTKRLLLATGSSRDGYLWAKHFGHSIEEPVPSLFTFNIPDFSLSYLSGVSLDPVEIKLVGTHFSQKGPLLITHFGLSGPAILKLSAWGARHLHTLNYQTDIAINWLCEQQPEASLQTLLHAKAIHPHKTLFGLNPFSLPKKLWKALLEENAEHKLNTLADKKLRQIVHKLHNDIYSISGKTTHKEEFVTCGGVSLKMVDFKTMQSKLCPGLFFAGEILDIDGVTGGFNFQNAWTTGYLAGTSLC